MHRNHGQGHSYFPRPSRKDRIKNWFKAHRFGSILAGNIAAGLIVSFVVFLIALVLNKISEAVSTMLGIGFAVAWTLFWACVIMYYIEPAMRLPVRQFTRGVTRLVSQTSSRLSDSIRKFRK